MTDTTPLAYNQVFEVPIFLRVTLLSQVLRQNVTEIMANPTTNYSDLIGYIELVPTTQNEDIDFQLSINAHSFR